MLLVDAAQGIEAQTLANAYQALEHDLEIVAVLNKIDLPAADPDRYARRDRAGPRPAAPTRSCASRPRPARGCPSCSTPSASASRRRPATPTAPLQALIFDSYYDQYRGVVSSVRVVNGTLRVRRAGSASCRPARSTRSRRSASARPLDVPVAALGPGEVGLPHRRDQGRRRGPQRRDGHRRRARPATEPLEGYQDPKPMVFCGLYPIDGDELPDLRDALEKLRLNDASLHLRAGVVAGARASGSAAASSACCTWRSSASASSASSTCRSSPPRRPSTYRAHLTDGTDGRGRQSRRRCPTPQQLDHIDEPFLRGDHPHPDRVHRAR